MAESLVIHCKPTDKAEIYPELLEQLTLFLGDERDEILCMTTTAAALKDIFNFFWVGFYRVQSNELVVGPFQGPLACLRIGFGKGVCGSSWKENRTLLVPDVNEFPGHIACSSDSLSEIVVPVRNSKGEVMAVLDVDSSRLNDFDELDLKGLETMCEFLGKKMYA